MSRMPQHERARLSRLANEHLDAACARMAEAGMPGQGICASLIVKYASVARASGGSLTQALEAAAECIAVAYDSAPAEQWAAVRDEASKETPS